MEFGDQTEVIERGANLSGGQKARISLARAVYSDADIVLMDDPFSALDPSMRRLVFCDVILGLLAKKTRVLVTHSLEFLPFADKIVVMEAGRIKIQGCFAHLKDHPRLQELSESKASRLLQLSSNINKEESESESDLEKSFSDTTAHSDRSSNAD